MIPPLWNFSENSADLVPSSVPYSGHWKALRWNWANIVNYITLCKSMTQILANYPKNDTFLQRERHMLTRIYLNYDFYYVFIIVVQKWQCLNPNHPFGRKLLQSVATYNNFKLDPANFSTAYFVPWNSNYQVRRRWNAVFSSSLIEYFNRYQHFRQKRT